MEQSRFLNVSTYYGDLDLTGDWLSAGNVLGGPGEEFNPSIVKRSIAPEKPQDNNLHPFISYPRRVSPSCERDEDLGSRSSLPSLSHSTSSEDSTSLSIPSHRYYSQDRALFKKPPPQNLKRDPRTSLGLTLQNISILKNAFACVPDPSPSDYIFLAHCLNISRELDAVLYAFSSAESKTKPRKVQNRPVAKWKVKIIRRGVGLCSSPADSQFYFLAAGLRLDHLHLKQLFQQARKEEHVSDAVLSPCFLLQTKPAKQPSTATPPAEAAPTGPHLSPNNAVHTPVDGCPKIMSDDGAKTPSNTTSSDEEEDECEPCLETEVAAIVGPEYAHLAPILAQMSRALFVKAPPSSPDSVINTPASSFNSPNTVSDTSDASSPPLQAASSSALSQNTPFSSTGGSQKRKANGKGNADENSSDEAGDGDDNGRTPKRSKNTQIGPKLRYSCPVARRVIHMEQNQDVGLKSQGCAPDGLEFRHVWSHLLKSHFGCEICHTKFKDLDEGTDHLIKAKTNPEICKSTDDPQRFEIGIELCLKLKAVYRDKKLDHHQKWIEWWNLLCPGVASPDPLHAYTVSLSTADIPKVTEMLQTFWKDTPALPELDEQQTKELFVIIGRVIQLLPRVERRRQRRRPGTQQQQQQPQDPNDLLDSNDVYLSRLGPDFLEPISWGVWDGAG